MINMEIEVISQKNDELEIRIDNLTVAEILRVYLNEEGIKFAAWRRDHLTKPVIFRIESTGKTVKKAIADAISTINKDLNSLLKVVSK
jgi:DNA-directed RNA polymerase subunit L